MLDNIIRSSIKQEPSRHHSPSRSVPPKRCEGVDVCCIRRGRRRRHRLRLKLYTFKRQLFLCAGKRVLLTESRAPADYLLHAGFLNLPTNYFYNCAGVLLHSRRTTRRHSLKIVSTTILCAQKQNTPPSLLQSGDKSPPASVLSVII